LSSAVLLLILKQKNLEARVGIEPTHKGFADFDPSPKPLKKLANSVECSTEIGLFFHGFSPY